MKQTPIEVRLVGHLWFAKHAGLVVGCGHSATEALGFAWLRVGDEVPALIYTGGRK